MELFVEIFSSQSFWESAGVAGASLVVIGFIVKYYSTSSRERDVRNSEMLSKMIVEQAKAFRETQEQAAKSFEHYLETFKQESGKGHDAKLKEINELNAFIQNTMSTLVENTNKATLRFTETMTTVSDSLNRLVHLEEHTQKAVDKNNLLMERVERRLDGNGRAK